MCYTTFNMKFLKDNIFEIILNIIFIIIVIIVGNYMISWDSFRDDFVSNPTFAWLCIVFIFTCCTSGIVKMMALKSLNNRKILLLILLIPITEIILILYLVHKLLSF